MRLAISNIAWDIAEDAAVAELLNKYGIDAIDIAPGKYFPSPADAGENDIEKVRDWWATRGIEITGMQSLLFGTSGLNVFGSSEVQEALLDRLSAICRIGGILGASRLVFGSPKNRDRSGLSDAQAMNIAKVFFRRIGDVALRNNVIICLEPNPSCYGANFMTTSIETAEVVDAIAHPAIKMQLDTGALTINKESAANILASCSHLLGHVHASEPDLIPLGDGATNHREIYKALKNFLPSHIVSIEMVATQNEPHLFSVERALNTAVKYYRSANEANR